MITTLAVILFAFLIGWVIYWGVGHFITGFPLQIIGIIIGLLLLAFCLSKFGFLNMGGL